MVQLLTSIELIKLSNVGSRILERNCVTAEEQDQGRGDVRGSLSAQLSSSQHCMEENTSSLTLSSPKKCGKKRPLKKSAWIKEISKRQRNSGKGYVSSSKTKKVFSERKLLPTCASKCRFQCSRKFSEEERKLIFDTYWKLGDLERQRSFIAENVEAVIPNRNFNNPNMHRHVIHAFYLHVRGSKVRVCKLFFRNTLGINDRPIRTILCKKVNGFSGSDKRGKHGHHKKVNPLIKDSVRQHIDSIPRVESHYTRSHTNRDYIPGDKSLADLHRDYVKLQESKGQASANLMMYSRIFNNEYNISFFIPKKDLCNLCESYKNAPDDADLKAKFEEHEREKVLSRQAKEYDKSLINNKFIVSAFDLQAVMPCPTGGISIFYYKSKINSYNFTISAR